MSNTKGMSLAKNTIWMACGSVVLALANVAMSILIAKVYRDQPDTSKVLINWFQLAVALANPLIIFAVLNADSVFVTHTEERKNFEKFLGLRVLLTLAAAAVLVPVSFIAYRDIGVSLVMLVFGIGVAFDNINTLLQCWNQISHRQDRTGLTVGLRGILSFVLFGFGLYFGKQSGPMVALTMAIGGSSLASLIMLVFVDRILTLKSRIQVEATARYAPSLALSDSLRIAKLGVLSGVSVLLSNYALVLPKFFLAAQSPLKNGVFSTFSYILIGRLVAISLGSAMMPRLVELREEGNRVRFYQIFWKSVGVVTSVGIASTLFVAVWGPKIWPIVFNKGFSSDFDSLTYMAIAGTFFYVSTIQGYAMTSLKYLNGQLWWRSSGFIVTLGLCLVLIPKYDITGAALSTLISCLVYCLLGFNFVRVADRRTDWRGKLIGATQSPNLQASVVGGA